MAKVIFENVTKIYEEGQLVAVDGIDAEIQDGEFVTIVGPSGSGKSTLLRMIAGLEDITEGDITIDGESLRGVPPQHRGVAMVFQNYALYPHMTVRKNLSYGLKLTTDLAKSEINRRVEETAEMLGIEDYLDAKPANLSGGQQQRVATGRAIVRDPMIFLMDEPLSNLDAKLKVHMRTELQRIQNELGTTTIYVTHDQEEAMTMSDRILVLNAGELEQFDDPETVYSRPATKFVADFIGSPSMNFYDAAFADGVFTAPSFQYEVSEDIATNVADGLSGDDCTVGIRPEHIDLVPPEEGIEGTVEVVEKAGADNFVYLDLGDDECRVRVAGHVKPEVGSVVGVDFDEQHVHVFDPKSGENLLYDSRTQSVIV